MFKKIFSFLVVFLPWSIRRRLLNTFWGYNLHPKSKIGLAYFYPKKLILEEGAKIDHFTIAIHLDKIHLGCFSKIGRGNWITGFPSSSNSKFFKHQKDRKSNLIIGKHSAITKNHHLDCTNTIHIGDFVTVAGYQSQFLTHSVDIYESRQHSLPIFIGNYCFVGSNSLVLGGAILPSYSVLGAKSLLNRSYKEEKVLYGGVPAKPIKQIEPTAKYFHRKEGYIY